MDEMTNMNETTMENETSVEVVPEENVQMIDNEGNFEQRLGSLVSLLVLWVWLQPWDTDCTGSTRPRSRTRTRRSRRPRRRSSGRSPGRSRRPILHRRMFLTRTLRKLLKRSNVR